MNCYVLVGGRSRRMGQPKAGIEFGGSTFLERIAKVAGAVFDGVIAVQRCGEPPVSGIETTIFEPEHEDEAAVFGVVTALRHAAAPCFVIALDYPLMTREALELLRTRFGASRKPLLVPMWRGVLQPLCAGYAPEMAVILEQRIALRRYDLQSLADLAEVIPEDEIRAHVTGEPLLNVNTPDELEEALKIHEQQRFLAF